MIKFTHVKEYKNISFEAYKELRGFSHSFLKSEINGVAPEFIASEKVELGSLVDAILMQSEDVSVSDPLFYLAKKIAMHIQREMWHLVGRCEAQVSYSAVMEFQGFKMPVCGRLDWLLRNLAVIDLKVTSAKTDQAFRSIVDRMGYVNQQWNYGKMAGVKKLYLLPYSSTAEKCLSLLELPMGERNEFWEEKILKFGTV